ncbi:MAG: trypsin-like peptidase domain-containing protein [Gammaproteobacteria bacterium]|nr:trypsin-like peptidase domain-containing protein [Gammaproteobacteria bacterium]
MMSLKKSLIFLFQSITAGLALAFVVIWLKPELLANGGAASTGLPAGGEVASYADAVAISAPAVVNIHSARRSRNAILPSIDNPELRRSLEDIPGLDRIETTLGSGVIISPDGYVVTNNHVIEGAEAIQIALADGRVAQADVVGVDPDTDLAVLKVNLSTLPTVSLGRSDDLRVGDVVMAIGNPFGVGQTVTQGIISATGRNYLGHSNFENFIQTDAAINPGNSGGALINTRGEVIGISTAIFSRDGGSNGIGFAVPVNLARGVMQQLVEHGRVIRGWLGVDPQDLTPELAEAFDLLDTRGVIVKDVYAASPAERAGLEVGDIITHLNDQRIEDARSGLAIVASTPPGQYLRIRGVRGGEVFVVTATVTERNPQALR